MVILILAALATYRLSRMISNEEGPFMLFTKLRGLIPTTHWIGRGLECILCVSVWVALPLALYVDWSWTAPLTWLALSGITTLLWKWEQKR